MNTPLRVLIIEDSERDTELSMSELQRGGYEPTFLRVETPEAMSAALAGQPWDVIIADWNMPRFSAPAALALLKQSGLDIPFLVVSGSIGETQAVEAMKNGAHDYIMKDRLLRLAPAVSRELREAALRREHKFAEEAVKHLASFPEKDPNPIIELELAGNVTYVNPAGLEAFPDLRSLGLRHPVLEGFTSVLEELADNRRREHVREVTFGDKSYLETLTLPFDTSIVRCYLLDITDRKQAEKVVRQSEERYRALVETTDTGYVIVDLEGKVLDANPEYVRLSGHLDLNEIRGRNVVEWTADYEKEKNAKAVARCAREGYIRNLELDYVDAHGKVTPIDLNATVVERDGTPRILSLCRDITERKRAEEQILRTDRALRVLSECNKALVRGPDESALLNDICNIIVQMGGYQSAWIAFPEDDEKKTARIVAFAGCKKADLEALQLTWSDNGCGGEPTGTAIRTRKPCVLQDMTAVANVAPWRNFSAKHHCASAIGLPLPVRDRFTGALAIFSAVANAFTDEETRLLQEMADDLTYGIQALRTRADHARAEKKLLFDHALLKAQSHASIDGILVVNGKGEVLLYNRRFGEMWNMPPELLAGMNGGNILAYASDQTKAPQVFLERNKYLSAHLSEKARGEIALKDGRVFDRYTAPLVLRDGSYAGRIWYFRDVTKRKRAELKLKETGRKLQRMMEGTIAAMVSALEMRDPYTAGHEKRVAQLACAMAGQMGMSEDEIEGIRIAGYLHDIGKIAVPAEILTKPGKITANEFGIIKTHTQFGYDILKEIDFPWPVALAALQHHERMNGSGYPQGITGENIIPQARIIAVADVVEAMSSHRPYRPALGAAAAMAEISENMGTLYDPQAVYACNALFSEKRFQFE